MKVELRQLFELSELILESLEGRISEPRAAQLHKLLAEEPWARNYYCEYLRLFTHLNVPGKIPVFKKETQVGFPKKEFDECFWNDLLQEEQTAPAIEVEPAKPEPAPAPKIEPQRKPISRTSVVSAILAAAALLFVLAFVQFTLYRQGRPIATVGACLNADWDMEHAVLHPGQRLAADSAEAILRGGVVKIEYDNGVEVVLEGPVRFALTAPSEVKLEYGRLFAHVTEEGFGFAVSTPSSRIVDLGTEFGVEALLDGDSEVHVFKGKTLLVRPDAKNRKTSQVVTTGQACHVDSSTRQVEEIDLARTSFVRRVDSQAGVLWRGEGLSLADVVNGGNGFGTGRAGTCIHPQTGRQLAADQLASTPWNVQWEKAEAYLKAVPELPFVDCVIVPGRDGGNLPLTTTGVRLSDFPRQLGSLRWPIQTQSYYNDYTLALNGQTVGTAEQPVLLIHANCGITFDLEAMRQSMPGAKFTAFKTLCGISETRIEPQSDATAQVRIYLDGREVFNRTLPHRLDSAIPVSVDLTTQVARFLTLLVTSGQGSNDNDWCVFAEPRLLIEADYAH